MHETPPFLINRAFHHLFAHSLTCIVSADLIIKIRNITFVRSNENLSYRLKVIFTSTLQPSIKVT